MVSGSWLHCVHDYVVVHCVLGEIKDSYVADLSVLIFYCKVSVWPHSASTRSKTTTMMRLRSL